MRQIMFTLTYERSQLLEQNTPLKQSIISDNRTLASNPAGPDPRNHTSLSHQMARRNHPRPLSCICCKRSLVQSQFASFIDNSVCFEERCAVLRRFFSICFSERKTRCPSNIFQFFARVFFSKHHIYTSSLPHPPLMSEPTTRGPRFGQQGGVPWVRLWYG